MKILITGATGFVGAALVRELLREKSEVKVLVRKESITKNINGFDLEIVQGDLNDKDSLNKAMQGCDTLYHVAARYTLWEPDHRLIYKVNVEGTRNILDVALRQGLKKVVYTSTVGAIGLPEKDGEAGNENTKLNPFTMFDHYKSSKYLAEEEAKKFARKGLPLVIVNPSTPVGPGDIKPTPTGKLIVDFLNSKMPAYLDTGLNLIDVNDVAKGHILAASKGKIGENYILGNKNLCLKEIFKMLEDISGIKAPKIKIPYSVALAAAYINEFISNHLTKKSPFIPLSGVKMAKRHMYFDSSRAVKELGLPQTPIRESLKRAVDWFRENGYVKTC